jgi:hypothetical protein
MQSTGWQERVSAWGQGLRRSVCSTLALGLADIRAYPPAESAGILVLRPRDQRTASIVALLARVLPLLETESLAGALWIVDERRVRVRH